MGVMASLPFLFMMTAKLIGGSRADCVGRAAPFCMLAMSGSASYTWLGITTTDDYLAAIFIVLGMGMTGLGIPTAWARFLPPSWATPSHLVGKAFLEVCFR